MKDIFGYQYKTIDFLIDKSILIAEEEALFDLINEKDMIKKMALHLSCR